MSAAAFGFHDLHPDGGDFLREVICGLSRRRKALPPKFFYDERGCALFEAICRLPEYYLTRAEIALLRARRAEIAGVLGAGCVLIELGAGSARKTRILLGALRPVAYVPIDIARDQLVAACRAIAREYPGLPVTGVCADYTRDFELPAVAAGRVHRRAIFFPGSTIGNFTPGEAVAFLRRGRRLAGAGGAMLVGVDLRKDARRLAAAYDDSRGITAAFNLNLLARINRELGADFDLAGFRHRAFYNRALGRIEMHLESVRAQQVRLGGRVFRFRRGETIHTENSYKYSIAGFQRLARRAGFRPEACWTDPARLFALHYLTLPAA